MSTPPTDLARSTRHALHAIAESVMAGPQYRASGTIRLYITESGFGTRQQPRLAVDGDLLVFQGGTTPLNGQTLSQLAAAAGVEPGPAGIYPDGADMPLDETLKVDTDAARRLFAALHVGDAALRAFASGKEPVLWPEHFDLGVLVDDVAYGVSPGDGHIAHSYAYISATPPNGGGDDLFWNQSFGAARTIDDLGSAEEITAFFVAGQRRLKA